MGVVRVLLALGIRQSKYGKILPAALTVVIFACTPQGEEEASETHNFDSDSPIQISQPASGSSGGINSTIRQISTNSVPATFEGLPDAYDNLVELNITVGGAQIYHYKADLIEGEDCSQAVFQRWKSVKIPITFKVGADGTKRLCTLLTGETEDEDPVLTSFGYSWVNDTTEPTIAFDPLAGFGPFAFDGQVEITGTASDNLTGVASVAVSIAESGGGCLDAAKSSFDETCPHYIDVTSGLEDWSLTLSESIFTSGKTYTFTGKSTDLGGSSGATPTNIVQVWDTSAPSAPANLAVTGSHEAFDLSWDASTGAANYLVIRRPNTAVTHVPIPGSSYSEDQSLSDNQVVAYFGSSTSITDSGVDPYVIFHYTVFPVDAAGNIGTGVSGSDIAVEAPKFKGVKYAYLVGDGRKFEVIWDPYTLGATDHEDLTYEVFTATSSGGFDYDNPVATTIGTTRITVEDTGSSASLFVAVREVQPNGTSGTNTNEFELRMAGGEMHRFAGTMRFEATSPISETYVLNPRAVDSDPWGNVVFANDTSLIYVYCYETALAPYCVGKQQGKVHFLAGRDGRGDGESERVASETAHGSVYGIRIDAYGNLFFADQTYRRIRAICYDPAQPGYCYGKNKGYVYRVAGTGTQGDGADGGGALTEHMGNPRSLALDNKGNILVSDEDYRRVRLVCVETTSSFCSGRTAGNVYRIAGTGTNADGPDDVEALSNDMGISYAVATDKNGNFYFTDNNYYRLRAVCYDVSSSAGFCAGKTSGNMYHVTGTGSNDGDGGTGVVALGESIGVAHSLVVDDDLNIWYPDDTHNRIRVICFNTTASGFCNGRTVGNIYWAAGDSTTTDGADDSEAVINGIGSPHAIAIRNGNPVFTDLQNERIRYVCYDTTSQGICQFKTFGNLYNLVSSATSKDAPVAKPLSSGISIGDVQGVTRDSIGNIYFSDTYQDIVRVLCNDVSGSVGACAGRQQGYVYRVAGTGSAANGGDDLPAELTPISNPYGLAIDSYDNLFFVDRSNYRIRVVCWDVTGGYCNGKTSGHMYQAYGTGSAGDGADNAAADSTAIGASYGITLDSNDNVYFVDEGYHRIRVVCQSTAEDFCNGKTAGNVYRFAGNGSNGDGADNSAAASTPFGNASGIVADPNNNIYFTDYERDRIRVVCQDVSSVGFCNGRTANNVYRFAGTGSQGDGADDAVATSEAIRDPVAIASDASGNIYFSGTTYERIRIVCNETSYGFCNGKTAGNVYRGHGTGTGTNDATNLVPADQTAFGYVGYTGLHVNPDGTILFTDAVYDSIRMITKY